MMIMLAALLWTCGLLIIDSLRLGLFVFRSRSLEVDTGTVTGRNFEDEIVENMDEIDDVLDS